MPAAERSESQEGGERGKKSSSSKTKDLSHVPCKFFKVGSCTAGSSCPFSHAVAEPGAQKDVCAWFVKGNCKFGHKCALAHVLPGQPMTMDRKNKKAAQLAAGGGGKEGGKGGGKSSKRDTQGRPPITMSLKASISPSAPAPALKDTDFASFGALDESNKLPSAPAHGKQPDQSDTKPASKENHTPSSDAVPVSSPHRSSNPDSSPSRPAKDFGPIGSPPRAGSSTTSPSHPHPVSRLAGNTNGNNGGFSPGTSPSSRVPNGSGTPTKNSSAFLSTSPFSAPGSQSIFLNYPDSRSTGGAGGVASSLGSGLAINSGLSMNRGTAAGAGVNVNTSTGSNANPSWGSLGNSSDIGSIPVLGSNVPSRLNGTSAGATSTNVGKDFDLAYEYDEYLDTGIAGGIAARRAAASAAFASHPVVTGDGEEGDMEDFLPSSLTDLLTPEERSRRMSRSNSGQGESAALSPTRRTLGVPLGGQGSNSGNGNGHRYSRSVPAPSLLGDISSIWSNNNSSSGVDTPTSSGLPSSPSRLSGFGNGTASSFTSASGMLHDEFGPGNGSPSLLSPSNASAAFLPGLHQQYLRSKQQQSLSALSTGLGRGIRGVSNPLFGSGQVNSNSSSRLGVPTGSSPSAPSPLSAYGTPKTADNALSNYIPSSNASGLGSQLSQQHRPIPSHLNSSAGLGNVEDPHILSPSSRALQAHAPGQSLPQGLAAGYSRIHALPPVTSPGSIGSGVGSLGATGFSISPGVVGAFNIGPYGTNAFSGSTQQQQQDWDTTGVPPGLGHGQMSSAQHQHYLNTGLTSQNNLNNPANTTSSNENGTGSAELEAMFSKLSYSAAASRGGPANSGAVLSPQRNPSSSRWGQTSSATAGPGSNASGGAPSGALSPLSVPVTTGDDDDLFVLDR